MHAKKALGAIASILVAAAGAQVQAQSPAMPPLPVYQDWPKLQKAIRQDPRLEAWIAKTVAGMSLEQKVGQMVQTEMRWITPEEVRKYHIGTVFGTGGYWPNGHKQATLKEWLEAADGYWQASLSTEANTKVPVFIATEIVHGVGNIHGATLFPHAIGLGAARDPGLIRRIAAFEGRQLRAIGHNWAFGPLVSLARDDRWSRTYETYSEDPALVRAYAREAFKALQIPSGTRLLGTLATAKQFIGDGGTIAGLGTGLNPCSEKEMINLYGQSFFTALGEGGAQVVMLSPTSWRDPATGREEPIHGSTRLLTQALRQKMGFDGIVLSDWGGIAAVPDCSPAEEHCAAGIKAGIDMFMVPLSWKAFITNTIEQVKSGVIPMARIDEAVTRILRVKARAGLFTARKPSATPGAGNPAGIVNRPLAREAVRKSLVLLKNNRDVLPLPVNQRILVVGKSANSIPNQTGGWTLTYEGDGNTNADFPQAQSILDGIREKVGADRVVFSETAEGVDPSTFQTVIAVVGETPYAGSGEIASTTKPNPDDPNGTPVPDYPRRTLEWGVRHPEDRAVLEKVSGKGTPVVTVYVAGRPLYANRELNLSDAFVAAWLPGTEGGGVADVLFRKADGAIAHDFTGRLPFSWPRAACQTPLNIGMEGYNPLFAYGYGLTYADHRMTPPLDETPGPVSGCPTN